MKLLGERTMYVIPQLRTQMRYSSWFADEIVKAFRNADDFIFNTVHVVGDKNVVYDDTNVDFSPALKSILFELHCLEELFIDYRFTDSDAVFVCDCSFPGFVANLRTWFRGYIFTYCHATSLNKLDIFAPIRSYKWALEKAFLEECDIIFVASKYHKDKLLNDGSLRNDNIFVVGFPTPPTLLDYVSRHKLTKKTNPSQSKYILIPSRQCAQKVNPKLYSRLEEAGYNIVVKTFPTWESYYDALRGADIVLSLAQEETFGISTAEALYLGTPVLVPDAMSYSEMYPSMYKYNPSDPNDLIAKIEYIFNHYDQVSPEPATINLFNDDFYSEIIDIITHEVISREII